MQCCPKSIETKLNRIFSCVILSGTSWAILHKIFTCAMVNRQIFWVKEPIQYCDYQAGTTLHMSIVYSMLSKYVWDNIAQENYWCNVGPDHIVIYTLENNYIQCCFDLSESTLHETITCTFWPTARKQICAENMICNVVWISLGQHCTRTSPEQY